MADHNSQNSIIVIGGGLAGLTCAIALKTAGFEVTVIEKKEYPFHRVCGEYVSNEVVPYLSSLGVDLNDLGASQITKLRVSAPDGKSVSTALDLGGFGISRFKFDDFLYTHAKACGVNFLLKCKVNALRFSGAEFEIEASDKKALTAGLVIASYGKRSNLDQKLNRRFFYHRSPYFGVKYHIRTDFDPDVTQLDNFKGGYCGINKIEDDLYNLCYLSQNKDLKKYGSVPEFERAVLWKNPLLRDRFLSSDFVFDKPLVINEITFEQKSAVEDHILFCGDAAGMITPLCGNGMAMAIHGAKLLSDTIIKHPRFYEPAVRRQLEQNYSKAWKGNFQLRLKTGRLIQSFFGSEYLSSAAVSLLKNSPKLTRMLIKKTHGKPF